jgi:hypothetical protein
MPWHQIRAGNGNAGHMWVPMDDENTMVYNWHLVFEDTPQRRGRDEEGYGPGHVATEAGERPIWFRDAKLPIGGGNAFVEDVQVENNFRSVRNMDNKYQIDRFVQKTQTYSGIVGTNTQDRAVQESMGAIADRTLERLGTTDRAIITARRMLLKAIQTVQDGGDPPGVSPSFYKIRADERVIPADSYWFEEMKDTLFMKEEPKTKSTS